MRVDLLAVLLLQAEHHLHRRKGGWAIVGWPDELLIGGHGQLSCVFKLEQSALRPEEDGGEREREKGKRGHTICAKVSFPSTSRFMIPSW